MIITLTGTNDYLIRQTLHALSQQFYEKYGDHSVERCDGEILEAARLPELFQGVSLFAPERLVIVFGAAKNKPLWEELGEWLDRLSDGVMLVVVEPELDKRTKTYKALKKLSDFKELNELPEGQLTTWLQQCARSMQGVCDIKLARYLIGRVGTDQWQLHQELQKLINYQPHITKEAIDSLVTASGQVSAFELLDAALQRHPQNISQVVAQVAVHEDPYKLFGLLVSQLHALAVVQSAGKESPEVIAQAAGLHPFVVRKTQKLAAQTSRQELKSILQAVAQCDDHLKSTGADPWFLVEQCLGKIALRDW